MSSFVAKDRLDELTYDFSPYGGSGVIEEPSAKQIAEFRHAIFVSTASLGGTEAEAEKEDIAERLARFERMSDAAHDVDEKLLQAVAEVCSGQPDIDTLVALPYRLQRAFIGWLIGVMLNPEASTPATTK